MGLQVSDDYADLLAAGRKDNYKNWYLATYKKSDGTYGTALVLSDNEAKAEEHFKDYDMGICPYRCGGRDLPLSQQGLFGCGALKNNPIDESRSIRP